LNSNAQFASFEFLSGSQRTLRYKMYRREGGVIRKVSAGMIIESLKYNAHFKMLLTPESRLIFPSMSTYQLFNLSTCTPLSTKKGRPPDFL
jgi:hypothetical protein